jgi:cytochrome c-type biogenesis protein CcmF
VINRSFLILNDIQTKMLNDDANNASVVAHFDILSMNAGTLNTEIKYEIINGQIKQTDGLVEPMGIKLRFEGVSKNSQAIVVGIYEMQQDYIVMKAIIFPFMAVLWFGIVLMFSGLSYSIIRRTIGRYKEKETGTA